MPEEDMDMPPTRCRLSAVRELIKVCQSLSLALAASSRHRSRLDITAKSGRCACMLFNSRTRSHVFLSPFLITVHAMPMLSLLQLSTSELSVVRLKAFTPASLAHAITGQGVRYQTLKDHSLLQTQIHVMASQARLLLRHYYDRRPWTLLDRVSVPTVCMMSAESSFLPPMRVCACMNVAAGLIAC